MGYRNFEVCRTCPRHGSVWCCKIYDNDDKGVRSKEIWFNDWCDGFHGDEKERENYGVKPLFDPLFVHMEGHKKEWDELVARGIDPFSCEYLGEDGCMIVWEKRPVGCRIWKCDRLTEQDKVVITISL